MQITGMLKLQDYTYRNGKCRAQVKQEVVWLPTFIFIRSHIESLFTIVESSEKLFHIQEALDGRPNHLHDISLHSARST